MKQINAKIIQSKIQILLNKMQEQSFRLLCCYVFLLQSPFQMLYEKSTSEKSTSNYNYNRKNNLYLNNSFVLHFINTMLMYLRKMQKGARTNGVFSGSYIYSN